MKDRKTGVATWARKLALRVAVASLPVACSDASEACPGDLESASCATTAPCSGPHCSGEQGQLALRAPRTWSTQVLERGAELDFDLAARAESGAALV